MSSDLTDDKNESGKKSERKLNDKRIVEGHDEKSDLRGDYKNVALLLLLYVLQGIPLGISGAMRILLQNRGVSYKDQALFSLVSYPFTLKILWAPIVDSVYSKKVGRRKTWLIPCQLLIGIFMIFLAQHVNDWLGNGEEKPEIVILTVVFFMLWFLAASQDIAVDGWCLTMLQRRNVGWAGTCNSVGQTGGFFIGYVFLLVFESKDFCNKYIFSEPRDEGLITLAGFLNFWGILFLITTIAIALFKKEDSTVEEQLEDNPDFGIKKAYPILLQIVKLKPVLKMALILLTVKASFAACDAVTSLKLIEYGVPKEKIALLAIPLIPVQFILPLAISKFTAGPRPMSFYIKAFPMRLVMSLVIAIFVFYTPSMKNDGDFPFYFYIGIVVIYMFYQLPFRSMYVAEMSFFARVSDPLLGGTYMTLLNTISNSGGSWIQTFFLWLVDILSWKRCIFDEQIVANSTDLPFDNKCSDKAQKDICTNSGGTCQTDIDGYYIEVCINLIYGVIWFYFGRKLILHLQNLPLNDWYILSKKEDVQETELSLLEKKKDSV